MLFRIMKITTIIMNMYKKKDGMQRFGSVQSLVLICRVEQKPLRPDSRDVEVVAVTKVESVSRLRVVFFLSCKDRR